MEELKQSKNEEPAKEEPKKETANTDEPAKEEPKAEPKNEEPAKEEKTDAANALPSEKLVGVFAGISDLGLLRLLLLNNLPKLPRFLTLLFLVL